MDRHVIVLHTHVRVVRTRAQIHVHGGAFAHAGTNQRMETIQSKHASEKRVRHTLRCFEHSILVLFEEEQINLISKSTLYVDYGIDHCLVNEMILLLLIE